MKAPQTSPSHLFKPRNNTGVDVKSSGNSSHGRSILFVVPRFHTNLVGAVATLVDAGYKVHVFARMSARLEDHSSVVPDVFGKDPLRQDIQDRIAEIQPDVCFLRESGALSDLVRSALRGGKTKTYLYSLRAADTPLSFVRRVRNKLQGRPIDRVTPVPGLTSKQAPRTTLLPWPIAGQSPQLPRSDGPLRILCVGKLTQPRKNLLMVLNSVTKRDAKFELTFAGASDIMPSDGNATICTCD